MFQIQIPLRIKLISLAVLVAGAVGAGFWLSDIIKENRRLRETVKAAEATIERLDQKAEAEKAITTKTETLLKDIRNAPEADNGPVAPVLDDVLDRL